MRLPSRTPACANCSPSRSTGPCCGSRCRTRCRPRVEEPRHGRRTLFAGHFAAALAAKSVAPRASLGTLVFAAQWLDLLWPTLLLADIERVRIEPGATSANPLVFEHYPWSHSFAAVLAWALLIGGAYFATRRSARTAVVIAALVVSHWLLDAVVHVPDLPLAPGGPKVGAGLWNQPAAAQAIEFVLLAGGTAVYAGATTASGRAGRWGLAAFVAFIAVIQVGNALGPPPPSVAAIAWVGQAQWLLVAWAWWLDRQRTPGLARRSQLAA